MTATATATAKRGMRLAGRGARRIPDEITIVIHGTWASDGIWWRPNGDFFEYVKTELGRSDLYGKSDQFKWSGKNRHSQRRRAGADLSKWLKSHVAREVNVFGHSHGANVAMLATHQGIYMDRLVMLSPPVRSDYFANWQNVGKAYNIQASFDPVVAIASGGQWFKNGVVKEKKMKASGHSSSHDPAVWRAEKLAKFIGMPWKQP
ncbi:MAG: alpha/beta hydrolase [Fuerstiella sp.]|nr:alpha/beta hydrolase [Fuerstiella sp.]